MNVLKGHLRALESEMRKIQWCHGATRAKQRKIKKLIGLSSALKLISPAFLKLRRKQKILCCKNKRQHKTDGIIRDCFVIV